MLDLLIPKPLPAYLQCVKLGIYYFLSTSLIIFPTAVCGAVLGTVASIRYLLRRRAVGSFDAANASRSMMLLSMSPIWHSGF